MINKFLLAKTLAHEIAMSSTIEDIEKDIPYKQNECTKKIQDSAKKFIIFLEAYASNIFLDFIKGYFQNIKSYNLSPETLNEVNNFVKRLKDDEEARKLEEETGYKNEFRESVI